MTLPSEKLQPGAEEPAADPLIAPTGNSGVDALAGAVNRTAAPFQESPPPEQGSVGVASHWVNAALGVVGAPFELLNTGLSLLTAPFNSLVPGMPAAFLTVPHLGIPHAHAHPPSMMVPLPSLGATVGSGSVGVLISGIPAARAGDLGIAPTCGSFAPAYDVFTGSSNTFIGGSRAARLGLDMTRHCNPASMFGKLGVAMAAIGAAAGGLSAGAQAAGGNAGAAKMAAAQAAADAAIAAMSALLGKDPGIAPSMGALLLGNPTVLIGGMPLPDALDALAGAAGLLKAVKKVADAKAKKPPRHAENAKCDRPGHPVDPVTGACVNEFLDHQELGPGRFRWERYYDSGRCEQDGLLGYGFRHYYQRELRLLRTRAIYIDGEGRQYSFPRAEDGRYGGVLAGYELLQRDEHRFVVEHAVHGSMGFERESAEAPAARLVAVVGGGSRMHFGYDAAGRLAVVAEAGEEQVFEQSFWFTHDEHGRLTEIRRSRGHELASIARYAYDEAGCLRSWTDPLGAAMSHAYDEDRRMTRETDRNGFSFFYKYDAEGRCIASAGQDQVWRVQLKYEPGRTLVTEADGGRWVFMHNEVGTVTRIVDPYGGATERITGEDGRVLREVDSGGRVMEWLYDARGRNTGRRDRWGNVWPTKDEAPRLPNPLAHTVPSTSLALQWGRVEVLPPAEFFGIPVQLQAVAAQVLALPEPVHAEPAEVRDAAGRVVETIDIHGRREKYDFDAAGQLIAFEDKEGRRWHYSRASWRMRGAETDPLGHTTQYGYTLREKVALVVDANGNESGYEYDHKDRLVSVKRHGVLRESYRYDTGDRLVEKRDANGRLLLSFEVGENGLHRRRILSSGEVHRYRYDARGRFTEASTERHAVHLGRDATGRRTSDLRDGLGVQHEYRGARAARTMYFGRFVVEYTHGADGDVLIQTPDGGLHRLQHAADGSVLLTLDNGTSEARRFDAEGRCVGRVRWQAGPAPSPRWVRYHYSAAGELLQVVSSGAHASARYHYDAAHRLLGETRDGWSLRRYAYDAGGNLLSSPTCSEMRYGEGNRLMASSLGRHSYNERNHLAELRAPDGSSTTYRYNSMDLLVEVAWSGREDVWTAEYDGLCRRIATSCGTARTEYYWDGDRLAAEVRADGRTRLYIYVDADAFLPFMFLDYASKDAPPDAGRPYFVFTDQVGLPEWIEDGGGQEVWRAEDIDPYGTIKVAATSTIDYAVRWPGHYFDAETGLHYNRFRSYSPRLGRYLQSDPMGQSGGLNLYAYSANPLVCVDVLGLSCDGEASGSDGKGNTAAGHSSEAPPPAAPHAPTPPHSHADGYPPRTAEAQAECQAVIATMDKMTGKKTRSVVSVMTHEDGTVSVGFSGASSEKNRKFAEDLQKNLNKGHKPPKYRVAPESMPTGSLKEVATGNAVGACAEPSVVNAAHGHPSPINGMDTRWRGAGDNPHPYTGTNADGAPVAPSQMDPCDTCGDPDNIREYMNHANS
ncbi:RHS repeat-associated core domain-containing protein [Eleftheria terrae]|uniref:RHS repeat-associated core domain-containing protein n=1 Tax=Eleftheria terrae TaxID=1597781 RepID=UPI00263ABCDF|nr:RHS repeat-associated core domain-containing protein [Eleftheria terrae]WKB53295.1 DUF6531 domain-containing protein [Eleftheria terrae]